ncbi:MAG: helix-turn-helix domain-containing protein [Alphaproteobacteria bacterium]
MKKSIYSDKHRKLCELLIEARNCAGLTQQELASQLRKPQSFIAKYEGGERRLDLVELIEISSYLNLDLCAVIKELEGYI